MADTQITVQLVGGLGNQMFGAAAGIALAKRNKASLAFDLSSLEKDAKRAYALQPFGLDAELVTWSKPKRRLSWSASNNDRGARWKEQHFWYDPTFERLTGSVHLSGYLQSPHYFAEQASAVRAAFDPSQIITPKGADLAAAAVSAGDQAIAVHVRRGDYVSDPKAALAHGVQPESYYVRALELIKRSGTEPKIFLVSDDIETAATMFERWEVIAAHGTSELDDMYLISQCHHRIIANSSFSWWGAWLGQATDGLTIAPRMWFTKEKMTTTPTFDLLPEEWVLV